MIQRYEVEIAFGRPEGMPSPDGHWVRYSDHLAALRSVRQILSEMCPKCQGTCLPGEKPDRTKGYQCVQCRTWSDS